MDRRDRLAELLADDDVETFRHLAREGHGREQRADVTKGPIFRAIDRWEAVEEKALTPQSINLIVKRRRDMAGLEPEAVFRTRTARRISDRGGAASNRAAEAMQQSQQRSDQQAASYYNEAEHAQGRAARLGL